MVPQVLLEPAAQAAGEDGPEGVWLHVLRPGLRAAAHRVRGARGAALLPSGPGPVPRLLLVRVLPVPGRTHDGREAVAGADLIFDLDADHVSGADSMSYRDMLARIKVELVADRRFLLGDLGRRVPPEDRVLWREDITSRYGRPAGGSPEPRAREIVDYIAGTDLSLEWCSPRDHRFPRSRGSCRRAGCAPCPRRPRADGAAGCAAA